VSDDYIYSPNNNIYWCCYRS